MRHQPGNASLNALAETGDPGPEPRVSDVALPAVPGPTAVRTAAKGNGWGLMTGGGEAGGAGQSVKPDQ